MGQLGRKAAADKNSERNTDTNTDTNMDKNTVKNMDNYSPACLARWRAVKVIIGFIRMEGRC